MKVYYSNEPGRSAGPVDKADLLDLHSAGTISDSTKVRLEGSDEWNEIGDLLDLKEEQSLWGKLVTALSGLLLIALGVFFCLQSMVKPLMAGVYYGRRGSETFQDQEPLWFWIQVLFKGAAIPLVIIAIGLTVCVFGLRGDVTHSSTSIGFRWTHPFLALRQRYSRLGKGSSKK